VNGIEIENIVARAKTGNRDELLRIIERYKPFIIKTMRSYSLKNYEFYDLLQVGYVALINAVSKYKAGSNVFSAYAYRAIENAYRYTARQNNRYESEISLFSPVCTNGNRITEYADYIEGNEDPEEDVLNSERLSAVRGSIGRLSPEEVELVSMIYYGECSVRTYADKKGISYSGALRRKKKVLEKLGAELENKLH
jgi:RNA polymerase sporulation-specific sigma factor